MSCCFDNNFVPFERRKRNNEQIWKNRQAALKIYYLQSSSVVIAHHRTKQYFQRAEKFHQNIYAARCTRLFASLLPATMYAQNNKTTLHPFSIFQETNMRSFGGVMSRCTLPAGKQPRSRYCALMVQCMTMAAAIADCNLQLFWLHVDRKPRPRRHVLGSANYAQPTMPGAK